MEESDNLPDPDVLAQEIVDDLEAALTREVKSKKVKVKIGEEEVKRDLLLLEWVKIA